MPNEKLRLEFKGQRLEQPSNYPNTPTVEDLMYYRGVIKALKEFKRETCTPLRQLDNTPERINEVSACYQRLHAKLCAIYEITPLLTFTISRPRAEGNGLYAVATNTINISGKFSMITYLHEFGHARGFNEHSTVLWSVSLFKRAFPRAYNTLHANKHRLMR
jgi:hypothetical protein